MQNEQPYAPPPETLPARNLRCWFTFGFAVTLLVLLAFSTHMSFAGNHFVLCPRYVGYIHEFIRFINPPRELGLSSGMRFELFTMLARDLLFASVGGVAVYLVGLATRPAR